MNFKEYWHKHDYLEDKVNGNLIADRAEYAWNACKQEILRLIQSHKKKVPDQFLYHLDCDIVDLENEIKEKL